MNMVALTFSLTFFTIYATIYFSLILHVDDRSGIRKRAIYNTCDSKKTWEIIELIDCLSHNSKVLVLPFKKRYWPFRAVILIFAIISGFVIFYDFLPFQKALPDKTYAYCAYTASLAVSAVFLFFETRYFKLWFELQKRFPKDVPHSNIIAFAKNQAENS